MTDVGVQAHLELVQQERALTIRAFVAAAPPRTLRWKVTTSSSTSGGTSQVAQSGMTQGLSTDPVSVTGVSLHSQGTVVLTVFEDDREIARDEVRLSGEPTQP